MQRGHHTHTDKAGASAWQADVADRPRLYYAPFLIFRLAAKKKIAAIGA